MLYYPSIGLIGHSKTVFFAQIYVVCATPLSVFALKHHDPVINVLVKAHPGDPMLSITTFFICEVFGALQGSQDRSNHLLYTFLPLHRHTEIVQGKHGLKPFECGLSTTLS